MTRWRDVHWVGLAGASILLAGFFLPWVRLDETKAPVAGWELGGHAAELGPAYYAVFLLPVLAFAVALLAVKRPRVAGGLGLTTGGVVLGWALFEVARVLYTRTFAGLWLSLLGAAVLFLGSLLTWRRGRRLRRQAAAAAPSVATDSEAAVEAAGTTAEGPTSASPPE